MGVSIGHEVVEMEEVEDSDMDFEVFKMDGAVDLGIGVGVKGFKKETNKTLESIESKEKAIDVCVDKEPIAHTKVKAIEQVPEIIIKTPHMSIYEDNESVDSESVDSDDEEYLKSKNKRKENLENLKDIQLSLPNIEGLADTINKSCVVTDSERELTNVTDTFFDYEDFGNLDIYGDTKQESQEGPPEVIHINAGKESKFGIAIKWLTDTFLTKPITAIFRMLYAGMFGFVGYIGSLLKFVLVSVVITTIFLILYTNFVNKSLSAADIATQNYGIIKELVVKIVRDFVEVIIDLFKK